MSLSIIILNYKNLELLKLCLQSVKNHLAPSKIDYEVLVVDSDAQLETEELLAKDFPDIFYLPLFFNSGYAKGVNYGLSKSQGAYLLILNPDVMITPQAVEKLIEFMEQNPSVGLVGPKLLDFGGQTQDSCFRFYKPSTIVYRRTFMGQLPFGRKALNKFNLNDQKGGDYVVWPDWLTGSALLTKREAVEKIGFLDERFFMYFEDVDWSKRFWENGYKVAYYPKAVMFHYLQRHSRAGLGTLDIFFRKAARWHLISGVKYFLKHGWRYRSGPEIYKHERQI